jgi:hypothetical protein
MLYQGVDRPLLLKLIEMIIEHGAGRVDAAEDQSDPVEEYAREDSGDNSDSSSVGISDDDKKPKVLSYKKGAGKVCYYTRCG